MKSERNIRVTTENKRMLYSELELTEYKKCKIQ